ncbi:MAG: hypothetical protein GY761_21565 [Hyphomicrobiales bacterium]|nr:hypothetical protein [Hyphomicrobiales bacterium]
MQKKLATAISLMVIATIVGLLVLLPFRLYTRDIDIAKQHARLVSDELSNMIKLTMLTTKEVLNLNPTMGTGVVYEKIEDLYKEFGKNQDFKFRVVRSSLIEKQFQTIKGRRADNPKVVKVFETNRPISNVDGVLLSYWSPIRANEQCGECHTNENRKKVKAGTTLGVVEVIFDLTREKQRSIRTIIEITGFLVAMIAIMAFLILFIVKKNLIRPVELLASTLKRRANDPSIELPEFRTSEMKGLVAAIDECSTKNNENSS